MGKKCIFHVPFYINTDWPSGTNIRPMKIIQSLKNNGYDVWVVSGYGQERKEKIQEIKKHIENGAIFDFAYSESSTEPTLLTEKNHFPKYPFLDFGFLKYLKKKGIRVGLFYRDIYWRFPIYNSVPLIKRSIAKLFYVYDLFQYRKVVDILYLPHKKMLDYSPIKMNMNIQELPPAVDEDNVERNAVYNEKLTVFYVGGISGLYDMKEVFKAFNEFEQGELIVCCRESEWEQNKKEYAPFISDNIKIIHMSGEEKENVAKKCDICSLLFQKSLYREFAMPLKLFEYMSYGKPIISTKGTATGEYVEDKKIGWNIEFTKEDIKRTLIDIYKNQDIMRNKRECILETLKANTWDMRGVQIINDLTSSGR